MIPDAVRRAIKRGWSVIPCAANKKPLVPSWKPYQERQATAVELERWAKTNFPAWAVITGALSKIVILDFDGDAGKETLAKLKLEPHVKTPSGGFHVYLQHPGWPVQTLNSKAKRELGARYPGMDIRADGGYALFCGRNEKGKYEWLRIPDPDPVDVVPLEVRQYLGLSRAATSEAIPPNRAARSSSRPPFSSAVAAFLEKALSEQSPRMGRNNAGFWLACQLRDADASRPEAEAVLGQFAVRVGPNNTKGQPEPYTEAEAVASVRKAYEAARREPAKNPNRHTPQTDGRLQAPEAGIPAAAVQEGSLTGPESGSLEPDSGSPLRFFPRTDLGNAERLIHRHGRDLRYCHAWKAWLIWDGRRWKLDDSGAIYRRAAETVRSLYAEAAKLVDRGEREDLAEFARKCESRRSLAAMEDIARSLQGVPVSAEDLDLNGYLLNVENGTIDLHTGELRQARREDLITKLAPVVFDAKAAAPVWEKFVNELMCGRQELIGYLQRAVGYSATGEITEKMLFICHGGGDNGKTTFLETLKTAFGDYAGQVLVESLMAQRQTDAKAATPDIADLQGLRLVTSSETEEGQRLAEAKVKYLTGMSTVKARRLYEQTWQFVPTWKLWIDCNHLPSIRGNDKAIWNRIRAIPFELQLGKEEIARALPATLRAELAGVIRWVVEGCLMWQRDGLGAPEAVTAATTVYQQQMDVLGRFLGEATEPGLSTNQVQSRKLYRAYCSWAAAAGEFTVSERVFSERLANRGLVRKHTEKGNVYFGLRLLIEHFEEGEEESFLKGLKGPEGRGSKVFENPPQVGSLQETESGPFIPSAEPEEELIL